MKCNICEKENANDAKYCTKCGNKINFEYLFTNTQVPDNVNFYDKSAKIGLGLGITGLILCFFLGIGSFFSIPGIVFSAIGKKSLNSYFKARKAVVISVIATVLNFALIYVYIYILRYLIDLASSDYLYYVK